MDEKEFETVRNTAKWASNGRNLDEPTTYTLIKDLADSHLLHIIGWIKLYPKYYSVKTLSNMEAEMLYRAKNSIFVPEKDNKG